MQRLSGLLLLLAGAGLGAYAYLPPPQDGESRLAEVTRISAAPDRDLRNSVAIEQSVAAAATSAIVTSAHAAPVTSPAPAAVPANAPQTVAAERPVTTGALSVAQQSGGWTTVVSPEAPANGRLTSPKAGDGETRAQLARDLQRELKRVGCYSGEVNGNWTPSVQRAMSSFMERVNATLPVDEPDYILLTLVQGHAAAACGADCPSGQSMSESGRCVPNAVVAQAARKAERKASEERKVAEERKAADERRVADERKAAEERRVAEARNAEDARKVADAREADLKAAAARKAEADRLAASKAAPTNKVTVAAVDTKSGGQEKLPWLDGKAAQSQPAARPAPPAGMMAVGGPRLAAADAPPTASETTQQDIAPTAGSIPAETVDQAEPSKAPSAAPVVVEPSAVAPAPPRKSNVQQQGLPGTKSGVTVRRQAEPAATPPHRPRATVTVRRSSPPVVAARSVPKPKYAYSASGSSHPRRYYTPRAGGHHYNMMQAYSGFY